MTDTVRQARSAERRLTHLAASLCAVESSTDLASVRSQAEVGGAWAPAAADVEQSVAEVWSRYPMVRCHVERLAQAVAGGRWAEAEGLLRPDAIILRTGGSVGVLALLDLLQGQLDEAAGDAARLAWSAVPPPRRRRT